ncbi:MAG TPA: GNAT family N-acetyltransferase [Ktedonobacterales bacterium]|nr:GNAT family N-acetyltransferase [Ktedonobacterales bacterium]
MPTSAPNTPKRPPPTVALRPVTGDNWQAVVRLTLAPGQEDFVASNVYSLAQAAYQLGLIPLAVYATSAGYGSADESATEPVETLVGFAMYSRLPDELGRHWIFRVMFDQSQQGKGYGRATMLLLLERMRATIPDLRTITLDFNQRNHVAEALYESLGFVKTGEMEEDEVVASLPVG